MYYDKIDSLRCYAVLAVLFSHFFNYKITEPIYVGIAGVDLFFVISGFLITEILLGYKVKGLSLGDSLIKFYSRRALRIFPIYYLYLLIIAFFTEPIEPNPMVYAFTYTINFFQFNHEVPRYLSHLWSLSIEEQFYLFWPLLLLIIPAKYTKNIILAAVLVSVFSRLFIKGINHKLLTTSCMDAFGIGAYFAYLRKSDPEKIQKLLSMKLPALVAILTYLSIVLFGIIGYHFLDSLLRLSIAVISFYLIGVAVYGESPLSNHLVSILDKKWSQKIGKISYGIYIYHLLLPLFLGRTINTFLTQNFQHSNSWFKYIYFNSYLITFPLYTLLSILLAAISFRLIEEPIAKFKNKYT